MDIISLKTFVAVAECRGFSRAAEILHLTQPAVSKRIAVLEESLESPLFDRIGKKVLLTEAGAALYPRAKRILLELEDSTRAIVNLSEKVSGRLSFGTSHHIGLHHLPPVLRRFSRTFPEVELDIHFLASERACTAVERGELEMAVVTMPNRPPPHLLMDPVWDDPLCVVAGRGHSLTSGRKRAAPVTPAELGSLPAILPGTGTFTRELIDAAFRPYGVPLTVTLSTNYLETIKMLVSVGLGWSMLPRSMTRDRDVFEVRVQGIAVSRSLGVLRHAKRTLSNAAREMRALLAMEKGSGAVQAPPAIVR